MAYKDPPKEHQFKPGQSGNPAGKPKGTKHLSSWIKELLNDEDFVANIADPKIGIKEYKGAPVKAIIQVAITKAVQGEPVAREWLSKYGDGLPSDTTPDEIEITFVNKVPGPKD